MKKFPAISILEIGSIATGIFVADQIVKNSPVSLIRAGTVHNGKYIILLSGSTASVEEAFFKGKETGGDEIIDSLLLTDVHKDVYSAISGSRNSVINESVGIFETSTIASVVKSADAGIKGAKVNLVEIRIADDLGGKGIAIFSGRLEEVQAALDLSRENITDLKFLTGSRIISKIDPDISEIIKGSTRFFGTESKLLTDGEI